MRGAWEAVSDGWKEERDGNWKSVAAQQQQQHSGEAVHDNIPALQRERAVSCQLSSIGLDSADNATVLSVLEPYNTLPVPTTVSTCQPPLFHLRSFEQLCSISVRHFSLCLRCGE